MAFPQGWSYKQQIDIDSSVIDSDLSDYKVVVKLTTSNFDFTDAESDGSDIRFTLDDELTLLSYERVIHDNINEIAEYHVKVPTASSSSDTAIFMYYGNTASGLTDGEDAGNVWESSYKRVYHCDDLTTSTIEDSTGNQDGTKGSANNPPEANSDLYKGQDFTEASSHNIQVGTLGINGNITIQALVKPDAFTTIDTIFGTSDSGGSFNDRYGAILALFNGNVRCWVGNNAGGAQTFTSSLSASTGVYQYVALRVDGSDLKLYLNGSTDSTTQTVTPNLAHPSRLGRFGDFNGHYFDGIIDELRVYSGALSDAQMKADYYNFTDNLLTYGTKQNTQSIVFEETVIINDSTQRQNSTKTFNESVIINDTNELRATIFNFDESVIINDTNTLQTIQVANKGTRILSVNPLIFVTNTSPAKIFKVDTTDPDNLTWISETVTGVDSLLDAQINETTNFVYVAGDNGLVVKIDIDDLTDQTITDLSDTDQLTHIDLNENEGIIYIATENTVGELYTIDERDSVSGDMFFALLKEKNAYGEFDFRTVELESMESDFKLLAEINTGTMECDIKVTVNSPNPIGLEDYAVLVDSVQLNKFDVDLESIDITHTPGEESVAVFRLNRIHDKIDYDLDNNLIEISNQNAVKITINGFTEFDGFVGDIDCQYNLTGEYLTVTAYASEKSHSFTKKLLSLPGLTDNINLYNVLIQNPKITNRIVDTTVENPIEYKGIKAGLGQKIVQSFSRYTEFDPSGSIANKITNGSFVARQNWTYFWSPTVRPISHPSFFTVGTSLNSVPLVDTDNANSSEFGKNFFQISTPVFKYGGITPFTNIATGDTTAIHFNYVGTSLGPVSEGAWVLENAKHRFQRRFDDIISRVGDTGVISLGEIEALNLNVDSSTLFTALQNAGYINASGVIQNSFINNIFNSEDLNIDYSKNIKNNLYNLLDSSVGYYVGEAPYQNLSVTNGVFIPKFHWVDRDDGLYSFKEAGYDYTEFVKKTADLEYKKLLNINGDISPKTSCSITMTIDAYYFYNLKLLNRINIDNTTQANIFKDNNGFPVSIKRIRIVGGSDDSGRKVFIDADNSLSNIELEELNSKFPSSDDDEYVSEEAQFFIAQKSDMKTGLKVT